MADRKSFFASKPATQSESPQKEEERPSNPENAEERIEALQTALQSAEAKAAEHYDRLLRVTAEFENYKKRVAREMDDLRKFATESAIREMLPTVDNLERALAVDHEDPGAKKGMREGVEMILKGFADTLERLGVVPIESLGKAFDPHFHQGISREASDIHPENTVMRELQKGYMLRDRLLRPAMVIVSAKPDIAAGKPDTAERQSVLKQTVH